MEVLAAYLLPLLKRYYRFVAYRLATRSARVLDKALFAEQVAGLFQQFTDQIEQDGYQSELYALFALHVNQQSREQEFISDAERIRERWLMEQCKADYGQPYVPVDDFVYESKPTRILKRLLKYTAYGQFIEALRKDAEAIRARAITTHPPKDPPQAGTTPTPSEPFQWGTKRTAEELKGLYAGLKKGAHIPAETPIRAFRSIFFPSDSLSPVQWLDSPGKLVYLFCGLARIGAIEVPPHIDIFIEKEKLERHEQQALSTWLNEKLVLCFRRQGGEPFTHKQLKNGKDFIDRKKKRGRPLDTGTIDALLNSL